jgi:mannose-6-phosphate isomerase-like protein (cupin superfamily)
MSRAGEVFENPVTGERVMVRVGAEESGGELLVADLYVRPGGAVAGEHVHTRIEEWFTVVGGRVGFRLDGIESIASHNERLHVPVGVAHDWWNAGEEEAHVVVEVAPGARFEAMIKNLYGLAQDGKTNRKGMPNLLQAALFAREFEDVLRFTKPPRPVQNVLFATLAPIARFLGYRGSYQEYLELRPSERVEVDPRAGMVHDAIERHDGRLSMVTEERANEVGALIARLDGWARGRPEVVAVGLVGSWARGEARMDSDLDVVLLAEDREPFVRDDAWVHALAGTGLVRTRGWGPVTERRFVLPSGFEVELGVAPPTWAATDPVDGGTRRVVTDGMSIVYDPEGLLARLMHACGRSETAESTGAGVHDAWPKRTD